MEDTVTSTEVALEYDSDKLYAGGTGEAA